MYLPRSFEVSERAELHALVTAHPLATLVSTDEKGLCADHLPTLLVPGDSAPDRLQCHVARGNPLWRAIGAGQDVLAVFQDSGCYVTPSWYASKAETQKVVPTWNYIAVHAYGAARAIDDPAWMRNFLQRLVAVHESARPQPWHIADAPEDYIAAQLNAIVGIEIVVTRWLGKWKVSQNRQGRDIEGVIEGLRASGDPTAARMADAADAKRP